MPRYIDANVLKEALLKERDAIPLTRRERYCFGVETSSREGELLRGGIRKALHCMEQTPTADVVEVRHGEWIIEHGDYGEMMCSVCKKIPPTERKPDPYEDFQITEFYIESPYCPHCGAKMDGERK